MHGLRTFDMRLARTAKEMSDAIRAYRAGESAMSIQARTGIPNQTLYAQMRKRGELTHQEARSARACRCGKSLRGRELRAKYCSHACSTKYRREDMRQALLDEGETLICLHCYADLLGKRGRIYCSRSCRWAYQDKLRKERVAAVAKYSASNINPSIIANRVGIALRTVRKYHMFSKAA